MLTTAGGTKGTVIKWVRTRCSCLVLRQGRTCILKTLRFEVNVYASFILPICMFKLRLTDQNSVLPATAVPQRWVGFSVEVVCAWAPTKRDSLYKSIHFTLIFHLERPCLKNQRLKITACSFLVIQYFKLMKLPIYFSVPLIFGWVFLLQIISPRKSRQGALQLM